MPDIMTEEKKNRTKSWYAELKKLIENQNYPKAVKTCNKILVENDKDVKAWQCKLVCFINLGNFKEGIDCLKKCKIVRSLSFEKAYCEYRCNNIDGALKTINNAELSNKVKELKAQILYRLERFDECYELYRDLVKNLSDIYDQERLTNLVAVAANRTYHDSNSEMPQVGVKASYEQLYNKSCVLIASGKPSEALKTVEAAETTCVKMLTEEGAAEDEITDEIVVLRTQKGCCLQMMGKEKEAMATYSAVIESKPDDQSAVAVINNNIAVINRGVNVFDTKKRIKAAQSFSLEHKLLFHQRGAFLLNQCILSYNTSQDEACEQEIKLIQEKYPMFKLPSTIVHAAILNRSGKPEEAIKILEKISQDNAKDSLIAILSAVQLLLSLNKVSDSFELLMQLNEEDKFKYGVLSALTMICVHLDKIPVASDILKNAVEWHKLKKASPASFASLCRHCADFHLRTGSPETSALLLEELLKMNPSDTNTLAELISAYSQFDAVKAQKLSSQLPDAMSLVNEFEVDQLVASVGQKYGRKMASKTIADASPASPTPGKSLASVDKKSKKKKKRKLRLPKNYDPNIQPNVDRWLPRWQRQTTKKRRDKRVKDDVGRGTQGVSNEQADKFDIRKNPGQGPKTQAPQQSEWTGPKRGLQKNRRQKKKK